VRDLYDWEKESLKIPIEHVAYELIAGNHRVYLDISKWLHFFFCGFYFIVNLHFVLRNSGGTSWPGRVIPKFITDVAGVNHELTKEEWMMLADFENLGQETRTWKTNIFAAIQVYVVTSS
jgi:hypothetical protein